MEIEATEKILKLCPQGRFGAQQVAEMLPTLQQAEGGFELDLSAVESLDICALQVILCATASMRRREKTSIIQDSEAGVLRNALALAGIGPEKAGLSVRLLL